MPEHPPWENWTLSYDRDVEAIVRAEQLGYKEYWVGEHHTGGYENVPVPEYLLAKASALTGRIRLGTGVVNLPYHDPFQVAERLAFLDHLTHGRLEYGFGGGGLPTDRALFGVSDEVAGPRTQEALQIIERLLSSSDPLDFDGQFWTLKDASLQVRPHQRNPPLALAGLTGPHNFHMCGAKGWAALSAYFTPVVNAPDFPLPDLAAHAAAIVAGAEEAGRDPDEARSRWRITREVYVSDSKNQAMNDIREGVRRSYDYLVRVGLGTLMKTDLSMSDADLTFEWLIEEMPWIIGSPDDCVSQLAALDEELGGFGTLLINSRDWVTSDRWYRSLELFARYVIPQIGQREEQIHRQRLATAAMVNP